MKTRKALARWEGTLKEGKGILNMDSLGQDLAYNFTSRFEEGDGTNPEELIAAAHSGCFSMALAGLIAEEGFNPKSIHTIAKVSIDKDNGGFGITESSLKLNAVIPGIGEELFHELAEKAKANCPVSKALSSIKITLEANLIEE
jgi:lipoyl-dependent peroxiredoxin